MPTYDYKCNSCGNVFEVEQKISEQPLTDCPECKTGKVRRLISGGAGISFKGSGFYSNDSKSAKKEKPAKPACSACAQNESCPKAS